MAFDLLFTALFVKLVSLRFCFSYLPQSLGLATGAWWANVDRCDYFHLLIEKVFPTPLPRRLCTWLGSLRASGRPHPSIVSHSWHLHLFEASTHPPLRGPLLLEMLHVLLGLDYMERHTVLLQVADV